MAELASMKRRRKRRREKRKGGGKWREKKKRSKKKDASPGIEPCLGLFMWLVKALTAELSPQACVARTIIYRKSQLS